MYIPEQLDFYLRPEGLLKTEFGMRAPLGLEFKARFCIPVQASLKADSPARGKASSFKESKGAHLGFRCEYGGGATQPEVIREDNTPKRGYRLVGQCYHNPDLWILLTPHDYLVSMPAQSFIPFLLSHGVGPGPLAELDAEFVWVVQGSQVFLLNTDSPDYGEYAPEKERGAKMKKSKLKGSDLEVGGVYLVGGYPQAYVGRVRHGGKKKWAFVELPWAGGSWDDLYDPESFQERFDKAWHYKGVHAHYHIQVKTNGGTGKWLGKVNVTEKPTSPVYVDPVNLVPLKDPVVWV